MRGYFEIGIQVKGTGEFESRCNAALFNIGRAAKKGTIQACQEILAESLRQVPRDTNTLANSAYYYVERQAGTSAKTWQYVGEVGYADNAHDPINPKTGKPASAYVLDVHEDLQMNHPRGGKAKFLEDPVRAYAERFPRAMLGYLPTTF